MHTDPAELDVPRPDGTLRVLRWGRGPRHAVALHGITASAAGWQPVAEALPTEWSLFAVDLRGRGHSAHLPGPYGWDRHLDDVLGAVAHLGKKGDRLTIMNFATFSKAKAKKWKPRVIVLGKGNRIVNQRGI